MLKVLEEWPERQAINDVKLNQRIYAEVLEAHQWHVYLDKEEDQKIPTYILLLDAKKSNIYWMPYSHCA